MLRLVTDLIGQPVVSETDNAAVGAIREPFFDLTKGKLVAYGLGGDTVLATVDVRAYLDRGVTVSTRDAMQPAREFPALAKELSSGQRLIGMRAVTQKGDRLGKAIDAAIETEGHFLVKLHVRPPVWRISTPELIIPRERIVGVEQGRIVVRYDDTASPAGLEPEVTP